MIHDVQAKLEGLERHWECVVIGGGPAGAIAAICSAKAGLKTLLIERHALGKHKVCGACLNHRALRVLTSLGLHDAVRRLEGQSTHSFWLKGFGGELERRVPEGFAVSRSRLDRLLVTAAIEAGASVIDRVTATVEAPASSAADAQPNGTRGVRLNSVRQQNEICIQAKAIVVADGLGHPSLKSTEFEERIAESSHVGIGAVVIDGRDSMPWVRPHTIHMAAASGGYAGLVLVEGGDVNLAAAVDPTFLRACGSPEKAFSALLGEAGFPSLPASTMSLGDRRQWRGTPSLSRSINRVASERVFVVGDASGYVEPFTGEGMAWAMHGGALVTRSVKIAVSGDLETAEADWAQDWRRQIYQSQRTCRRLAWLLRHPTVAKFGVSIAARFPGLTGRLIDQFDVELSA
ncbi:FAD-dependent monooxygenase [Roseiconus lacunae]|uniref:NAD(P)/FAD-dependent oxidoreductase n=1 Tax=Roseiconus lacunae TaxID=2605694 RepID=UPI003093CEFD|nr:FAD-dependent monooxygenase [Stieleria sp. HD01]